MKINYRVRADAVMRAEYTHGGWVLLAVTAFLPEKHFIPLYQKFGKMLYAEIFILDFFF